VAIYGIDQQTHTDPFCAEIVHGVRSILTAWDVYHAPWIILASIPHSKEIRLEAFWDTRYTAPLNTNVPLDSTHFSQTTTFPIKSLVDVNLVGLARALRKRMIRMTERKK